MTKVGVIGSGSMVGSRFCELAKNTFTLIEGDFPEIDITQKTSVEDFFKNDFEYVILFSAYTDVDGAEAQRNDKSGICWKINVEGLKNVADKCKLKNIKLVFISTEFVFDGHNGPYSEEDKHGPDLNKVSWYGITKIEGEKYIQNNLQEYLIIRITYPYRARFKEKEDFAKKIISNYKKGTLYPMYTDQVWTPTFIDDLFPAISNLIEKGKSGIYHVASPTTTTPYEFAKNLLETFEGNSKDLKQAKLADVNNASQTPRPLKGGLKIDKIKNLGFTPTAWQDGIFKIFEESKGELI